jgi:hypothetical protein
VTELAEWQTKLAEDLHAKVQTDPKWEKCCYAAAEFAGTAVRANWPVAPTWVFGKKTPSITLYYEGPRHGIIIVSVEDWGHIRSWAGKSNSDSGGRGFGGIGDPDLFRRGAQFLKSGRRKILNDERLRRRREKASRKRFQ